MRIGLGLGLGQMRTFTGGTPAPPPLIASVNAEGWSAEFAKPADLPAAAIPSEMLPDSAPKTISVSRVGFDATAATTSYLETRIITKRKRQAYPNYAQATAQTVALDDYVYSTDTITGVVNNSAEASPKPIAAWVMPSRLLVGNSVHWELIAFHRDFRSNRQVACVRVRANDGTTQTPWQTVAATVISTLCEDANPLEVYAGDLDVTALATGAFWLEAEVYPWIGAAPSVLKSEDLWAASASPREFTRRYYHKDVALAAAPPLAYVKAGGSDTAGVWSVNAATALATPFATVAGACSAITNVTRGTPSKTGTGARIRIVDNTANNAGTNGTSFPQGGAGIVIERAPGVARASAVLNLAGNLRLGLTCSVAGLEPHMTLNDLSVGRSVNTYKFYGEAGTPIGVQFWNVAISDTAGSSPWNAAHGYFFGATFATTNLWLSLNTGLQIRMTRGVVGDLNSAAYEQWVLIGCAIQQVGSQGYTDATKGGISYANRLLKMKAIAPAFGISATNPGDKITGVVILQNVFEVIGGHANASPAIRLSSDGLNGDMVHSVIGHNTTTGFYGTGRNNTFYDESSGTNRRNHRLLRMVGNIWVSINTKGDIFYAGTDPSEAPNRIGQLAYVHGVGCQGEYSQFCSADGAAIGSSFSQLYPGLGASIGTSASVRSDPLFVDYQSMTGPATYGAGGGDYRLQAGSPARGRVTPRGLAYDLAGATRPAVGTAPAGAYV
ncbi:MAG: hypothetical protein P0Y64_16910 [Candidatus Sphingomonas colombiensis]|nr:hypothetical protein [Sphingomonas sp.]WEK43000.1 MAG: hypothetical protein P0Y64_16910 [Sphingomonas sp.]